MEGLAGLEHGALGEVAFREEIGVQVEGVLVSVVLRESGLFFTLQRSLNSTVSSRGSRSLLRRCSKMFLSVVSRSQSTLSNLHQVNWGVKQEHQ